MFYQRLRDLREDKDLKQVETANIINTSVRQYGLYERGKTDIPLEKALILAKYYNVSLDYITGLTNDKKGLTKSQLNEDVSHLVKSYELLSERRKGRLDQFMQQLIDEQKEENAKIKGVI